MENSLFSKLLEDYQNLKTFKEKYARVEEFIDALDETGEEFVFQIITDDGNSLESMNYNTLKEKYKTKDDIITFLLKLLDNMLNAMPVKITEDTLEYLLEKAKNDIDSLSKQEMMVLAFAIEKGFIDRDGTININPDLATTTQKDINKAGSRENIKKASSGLLDTDSSYIIINLLDLLTFEYEEEGIGTISVSSYIRQLVFLSLLSLKKYDVDELDDDFKDKNTFINNFTSGTRDLTEMLIDYFNDNHISPQMCIIYLLQFLIFVEDALNNQMKDLKIDIDSAWERDFADNIFQLSIFKGKSGNDLDEGDAAFFAHKMYQLFSLMKANRNTYTSDDKSNLSTPRILNAYFKDIKKKMQEEQKENDNNNNKNMTTFDAMEKMLHEKPHSNTKESRASKKEESKKNTRDSLREG